MAMKRSGDTQATACPRKISNYHIINKSRIKTVKFDNIFHKLQVSISFTCYVTNIGASRFAQNNDVTN